LPAGQVSERLTSSAWISVAETGSAGFAQNEYTNSGQTEEIMQEIDAFQVKAAG